MIVSFKYRAYPDATTEGRLNTALDTCRWLYNKLSLNVVDNLILIGFQALSIRIFSVEDFHLYKVVLDQQQEDD